MNRHIKAALIGLPIVGFIALVIWLATLFPGVAYVVSIVLIMGLVITLGWCVGYLILIWRDL